MSQPPDDVSARARVAIAELDRITEGLEARFRRGRRVLSFQEYVELFATDPVRFGRDAAQYVRDMFDHFGSETVERPWGRHERWKLFDGIPEAEGTRGREPQLVGQEEIQEALYRSVSNFVADGRANRLVLLHGPNGSSKSTVAACVLRALEHYSMEDEGPLYRFHWVFPSRKTVRGAMGFGGREEGARRTTSFAHLPEDEIDARLVVEVRDHPLFLLPLAERWQLVRRMYEAAAVTSRPPEWLLTGKLCHKNHEVKEALLASYGGSLTEVLRHVQVERWFVSRRYRTGAVTLGPEVGIDARERQVTVDRSLSALPTALQATTLYEAHGELVEAAGGVLEFSDLLKRPIDAFRYLQLTLETGEVSLGQTIVQTNCVMIGSANEVHLSAFREHHEFPSFRGRFELVRAPYLRSYVDEERIYTGQITPFLNIPIGPHATRVAALFAVLTRMKQPEPRRYAEPLAPIVGALTVDEKADLYALGKAPARLEAEPQKVLRAAVAALYAETASTADYEGRTGVSPREMRTALLDAAQAHGFLSAFAVLSALDELCKRAAEFDWLREKPLPGGFHDHARMRQVCRARLLAWIEDDVREASGLVDEGKTLELFERYVTNVSTWLRGEKVRNPVTGQFEPADERSMKEVEALLGVKQKHDEHRRGLISTVAAWAIDHPGQRIDNAVVLAEWVKKLGDTTYQERRKVIGKMVKDLVSLLRNRADLQRGSGASPSAEPDLEPSLQDDDKGRALRMLERLTVRGYDDASALEALAALLRAEASDRSTP